MILPVHFECFILLKYREDSLFIQGGTQLRGGHRNFTSGLRGVIGILHRVQGGHRNFASTLPATRLAKNPNSSNSLNFQLKNISRYVMPLYFFILGGGGIVILHRVKGGVIGN